MQIITKGSNYSFCGLGSIIVQDLRKELAAVYGEAACTDERMYAIQRFMSRLDWGNEDGIFGKLDFVMLPFMCNGVASINAFYDLKSKNKVRVGFDPVLNDSNVATHYAFDQYGCYPKYNADTSIKATCIGYPMTGKKAYNSSEFALFRKIQEFTSSVDVMSCGSRSVSALSQYSAVNGIRQAGSGYLSFYLTGDTPGLSISNFCCFVCTGNSDLSTTKFFTNAGECFARTQTGEININTNLDFVNFGNDHKYDAHLALEKYSFSVMGHAVGLTSDEARIVRDALMELKVALSL